MTSKSPEFSYEVIIHDDPETGELILPIPQQLLNELGWQEGDDLSFDLDDQGRVIISKQT